MFMYSVPCQYFNHTLIVVYFYLVCVIRPCSVLCMDLREMSDFVLHKCLFFAAQSFRLVTVDKLKNNNYDLIH